MIWVSSLRGLPTFHFHISMKLVSVARYEIHPIRKIERRLPSPSPKNRRPGLWFGQAQTLQSSQTVLAWTFLTRRLSYPTVFFDYSKKTVVWQEIKRLFLQ